MKFLLITLFYKKYKNLQEPKIYFQQMCNIFGENAKVYYARIIKKSYKEKFFLQIPTIITFEGKDSQSINK